VTLESIDCRPIRWSVIVTLSKSASPSLMKIPVPTPVIEQFHILVPLPPSIPIALKIVIAHSWATVIIWRFRHKRFLVWSTYELSMWDHKYASIKIARILADKVAEIAIQKHGTYRTVSEFVIESTRQHLEVLGGAINR
jgi:hypothetical protein